ncbi:nucleoporin SEH1-like protein [Cricetulus griseus]|nr:nucleoporin SEH1-like protein [Cricetulus griseus]
MFVARSIAADHKDLIHDVSFDFHGRRMATCSSDQSVKVWDKSESGDWHCTASWKTHSGSVWRVTWAHPEFGQVLASCSFDRTAAVWEEIVGESNDKLRGQSHWSVPFISSSRAHSPMIAVGSDDSSPNAMAKVQIFEYNENTRKYAKAETLMTVTDPVHDIAFAPNLGRSFHILAIATKDVRIFTLKPVRKELTSSGGPTKFEIHIVAQFDNHNSQVWRASTGPFLTPCPIRYGLRGHAPCSRRAGDLAGFCGARLRACSAAVPPLPRTFSLLSLCVVKHEAPLVVWRTPVYMTTLPFAVTILWSCFWYFHYIRTNFFFKLQLCGQSSREMEDFRGIAEESFPSFSANSPLGNSEVLENVTLSSNFGLPIAVSTLARNRPSTDNRCLDVQESYLIERRLSVPFVSSPSCQSDNTEPREKLQLSFQGDEKKNYIESAHVPLALMAPRTEEKQANTTTSNQCQPLLDEISPLEQVPVFLLPT